MQRSNTYILLYTIALTVFCGVVLSLTSMGLKPYQNANKEQERKINIVSTIMDTEKMTKDEAVAKYNETIQGFVVDFKGNKVEGAMPDQVNLKKEYKKKPEERNYPVYVAKGANGEIEYYIVPTYGFGLWNDISGYVSLKSDLTTINGITFDHVGETPGLGARIKDDPEVPKRYIGKKLFDESGELKSVVMQKGEGNNYDGEAHKVDGMSGATLTAKGVNNMMNDYFAAYKNYFNSIKNTPNKQ